MWERLAVVGCSLRSCTFFARDTIHRFVCQCYNCKRPAYEQDVKKNSSYSTVTDFILSQGISTFLA